MCGRVSDRCTLENAGAVEQCQMLLLECLLHLLAKNHVDDHLLYARIIAIIVRLRTESLAHSRADGLFITEWRDKVDFPPVFLEMWS